MELNTLKMGEMMKFGISILLISIMFLFQVGQSVGQEMEPGVTEAVESCSSPCQIAVAFIVRPPDIKGTTDSDVAIARCARMGKGFYTARILQIWTKAGGSYGERHYLVVCRKDRND